MALHGEGLARLIQVAWEWG